MGFNGRRPKKQQKAAQHKQQEPHKQKQVAQTTNSTKQQRHRKKAPEGSAKAAKCITNNTKSCAPRGTQAVKAAQAAAKAAQTVQTATKTTKAATETRGPRRRAPKGLFVFSLSFSWNFGVSMLFLDAVFFSSKKSYLLFSCNGELINCKIVIDILAGSKWQGWVSQRTTTQKAAAIAGQTTEKAKWCKPKQRKQQQQQEKHKQQAAQAAASCINSRAN